MAIGAVLTREISRYLVPSLSFWPAWVITTVGCQAAVIGFKALENRRLKSAAEQRFQSDLQVWCDTAQNRPEYKNRLTAAGAIRSCYAAQLSVLNLRGLRLTSLPDSISKLTALQKLDLSDNRLRELPDSISKLTALQKLDLSDNRLRELPESIGKLTALQKLDLSDNRLRELPESIGKLTVLQWLDLSGHRLQKLPDSISKLAAHSDLFLNGHRRLEEVFFYPLDIKNNSVLLKKTPTNEYIFNEIVDRIKPIKPTEVLASLDRDNLYSVARSAVDKYRLATRVSPKLCPNRPAATAAKLFEKMLRSMDGICLGETHNEGATNDLLQKNMAHLKKLGVNAFFVEGAELQNEAQIKKFNARTTNDTSWADPKDRDTLITAREFGIKVYPIDCARGSSSSYNPSHLLNLNYAALLKVAEIKKEDPTLGKYIVWVGSRHTNTTQINSVVIPGISELLNIPSLIVKQNTSRKETIQEATNHPSLPGATANAIIWC